MEPGEESAVSDPQGSEEMEVGADNSAACLSEEEDSDQEGPKMVQSHKMWPGVSKGDVSPGSPWDMAGQSPGIGAQAPDDSGDLEQGLEEFGDIIKPVFRPSVNTVPVT
ncbi:prostaglandin E2 receptor EP4 subtype [Platysternon megacephalum]|uniref:Prostaglandin E2 receptor EP4 subtype n=1 Tax=Platysternon megacephalum TaxID=55544 RepID=A0A4D9ENP8_9SAUR|nr:prostaglandin E2 receptor EP4 subtype [Platysternon megacephalum]